MEGFVYNQPVNGRSFIARKQDAAELAELLRQGVNVVMFEPPKSGKTSLIDYALASLRMGKSVSVAEQSLLRIREIEEAACRICDSILRTLYHTPEELDDAASTMLAGSHFRFDGVQYALGGCALSLTDALDEQDVTALAALPCRLPHDESRRLVILLEEFQNIMQCERGMWFCKMFEKALSRPDCQDKSFFSWMFCGSCYNAMREIFDIQKFFFFNVKRVRLSQADPREIVDYANKTYLSSGKVIDKELMEGICRRFKCNLWYINHFCAICDGLSKGYIMGPILDESMRSMIGIHEPRFRAIINDLTTFQLHLLRAIVDGHKHFSAADTIKQYGLKSSANVRRLKDALSKKEIITFNEKDEPEFLDPLFEYWVTNYYFEIKK